MLLVAKGERFSRVPIYSRPAITPLTQPTRYVVCSGLGYVGREAVSVSQSIGESQRQWGGGVDERGPNMLSNARVFFDPRDL